MYKIIEAADPSWNACLARFGTAERQIHFTADYHRLMEVNGDGTPTLFVYEKEDNIFFHPFMKKMVQEMGGREIFDIRSVFGYTGPLILKPDQLFVTEALKAFDQYCAEHHIIAELIRFNPLLKNHEYCNGTSGYHVLELKPYVFIQTDLPEEGLLRSYKSRTRSYIKSAHHSYKDLVKVTDSDRDVLYSFFRLYKKHMKEVGAQEYYLFNENYYEGLIDLVREFGFLIYAEHQNELIAGLLFLQYGEVGYYHHGARDTGVAFSSNINKYLFHRAFEHQRELGHRIGVLGGGVGHGKDDSLYRFKRGYNGFVESFYMGKKVHNKALYQEVVDRWEKKYPALVEKYASYIDKYRFSE